MNERIPAAARAPSAARRTVAVLRHFLHDARGGTAIEYAMIGGLIFAVIAGSLKLYGARMSGVYGQIGSAMAQVD
jgi:Flp pilus assembly pilin Flp